LQRDNLLELQHAVAERRHDVAVHTLHRVKLLFVAGGRAVHGLGLPLAALLGKLRVGNARAAVVVDAGLVGELSDESCAVFVRLAAKLNDKEKKHANGKNESHQKKKRANELKNKSVNLPFRALAQVASPQSQPRPRPRVAYRAPYHAPSPPPQQPGAAS
jgi:hypothetical protein